MSVLCKTTAFPHVAVGSIPPASTTIQLLRRDMRLGVRAYPRSSVLGKATSGQHRMIARHGSYQIIEVRERGKAALRYVRV